MEMRELKQAVESVRLPDDARTRLAEGCRNREQARRSVPAGTRILLVAACLAAILSMTILALTPRERVSEAELLDAVASDLNTLHEQGLFVPALTEGEWTYHRPVQQDHFWIFRWAVDSTYDLEYADGAYTATARFDPVNGKLEALSILATPRPDWPVIAHWTIEPEDKSGWERFTDALGSLFGIGPRSGEPVLMEVRADYAGLFSPDLTAGQAAEIWRDYRGYERFLIPDRAPEEALFDQAAFQNPEQPLREDSVEIVFYQADGTAESWTIHCLTTMMGTWYSIAPTA